MEVVVLEDSPIAAYLEGEGQVEARHGVVASCPSGSIIPSYAPHGFPNISKFQFKAYTSVLPKKHRNRIFILLHKIYTRTIDSKLSNADNARFLERFRYLIVASQLLNLHTYPSYSGSRKHTEIQHGDALQLKNFTYTGAALTGLAAFLLAWLIHRARNGAQSALGRGRIVALVIILVVVAVALHAYLRRQWLQNIRQDTLSELSNLIVAAHSLDNVSASALSLIQEVELVSRGYQITPLPPITRIEERNPIRRCIRLRRLFRSCFIEIQAKYLRSYKILQHLAEELDLEKYYDIYDISDLDLIEVLSENKGLESEQFESIRALKLLAARYNITRKVFFCCLMALNASGTKDDFYRWRITIEEMQELLSITTSTAEKFTKILDDENDLPIIPEPRTSPLSGHEHWRALSRHISSLSSGIRGLQAKIHLLKDEYDRDLNESEEFETVITPMAQYESFGIDLKALLQEWEEGKFALENLTDRIETRYSSTSDFGSSTMSLGGLTVVEEDGSAVEALKVLNGETPSGYCRDKTSPDFEEVFEAIATPHQRSLLSREERLAKMKEDRVKRYSARTSQETNTKILRELESVIKMRPKNRLSVGGRVTSL